MRSGSEHSGDAAPSHGKASASGHSGTALRIEQLVRAALAPEHLEIHDDSAAHAGHRSAGGKGHFRLRIVSTRFAGLSALQRHRLVYEVLAPLWESELHAVSLTALTSEES